MRPGLDAGNPGFQSFLYPLELQEGESMTRRLFVTAAWVTALFLTAALCAPAGGMGEAWTPVEYRLYPAPEGGYVGDTMPFVTEEGTLELYYLYDTDHNGQGYHPIYKYSTDDLCGYEDGGMALQYGLMSEPDPALGTGSVLRDQEGLYHLFYTGHNDTGNGGMGRECVMHATSTDRVSWEKQPGDTFFSPDHYSKDDFRDPEVFWAEEEQRYWMLVAAREDTLGGVIAKYTSPDLREWTFEGPLYAPQSQYMLECPDLFRMGDTWYLTYSWDCVTYYAIGESMNGPFAAPEDNILDGKGLMEGNGFVFYAAKTAEWDGKTYLCGWLGRAGLTADSGIYQWAGNVLNHQLVQHGDRTLGVTAPEAFETYFTQKLDYEATRVEGPADIEEDSVVLQAQDGEIARADLGVRAPTMMLECDVTLDPDGCAGFAFGGSEADEAYTALCLDSARNMLHYEGYELTELSAYEPMAVTRFDFSDRGLHHVTLVCENEIVVLYIDDEKALSSRISHSTGGAHIGVFSEGCSAAFSNITMKVPE